MNLSQPPAVRRRIIQLVIAHPCMRVIACTVLSLALAVSVARAHDPYEITARASLGTNTLELRMTLAAGTAALLLAEPGEPAPVLKSATDLPAVKAALCKRLTELVQIHSNGTILNSSRTNLTFGMEDHIQWIAVFPRPSAGTVKWDATLLNRLPPDEPYGINLVVIDLPNNSVVGQQLLTAREPVCELSVSPLPSDESVISVSKP